MRTLLIVVMIVLGVFFFAMAQNKRPYPLVGEVFKDHTFYDLDGYSKSKVKISDFRGKWLILDNWGYSCTACLASFEKMEHLSKVFPEIQIIMVGATKGRVREPVKKVEKITKDRYQFLKKRYDLHLTVAFDSVIYLREDVGSLPHIFVIDPNGRLRAKTTEVDSAQLAALLLDKDPKFDRAYSYSEKSNSDFYNDKLPYLTSGKEVNGGIDTSFLYRSVFGVATDRTHFSMIDLLWNPNPKQPKDVVVKGHMDVLNSEFKNLYTIAYFGSNYNEVLFGKNQSPDLIFEVKDTLAIIPLLKTKYSYSVSVPKAKASVDLFMRNMQIDLLKYFGYKATIEKREIAAYSLEVTDFAKAKNFLSQKATGYGNLFKYTLQGEDLNAFAQDMTRIMHLEQPIFNRTGIDGKVYIVLEAYLNDSRDILAKLNENGLNIIKRQQVMNCIVLKD